MIAVIVAAHGNLGRELIATAKDVVQNDVTVTYVEIKLEDDTASYEFRLKEAVAQAMQHKEAVLILTDMLGGTPSNVGLTMHEVDKVEVLTGVNLPMLIKALQLTKKDIDLATAAKIVRDTAIRAICIASDVLSIHQPKKEKKRE